MCLSTVYRINEKNEKEKIAENIARVEKENDGYKFFTMFNEWKFVKGNIIEIDLLKATITIENN